MRLVRDDRRRDGEPALAVIRGTIKSVRAARTPAVREVGESDVVIAKISAADGRVGKLRPNGRLGQSRQHAREEAD